MAKGNGSGTLEKVIEAVADLHKKAVATEATLAVLLTHAKETTKAIDHLGVVLEVGLQVQAEQTASAADFEALKARVAALEAQLKKP